MVAPAATVPGASWVFHCRTIIQLIIINESRSGARTHDQHFCEFFHWKIHLSKNGGAGEGESGVRDPCTHCFIQNIIRIQ